ncbi:DUF3488 and transglutaminase-like domain-containing protein [Nocardioides sp. CFH 31398]|uniref:transglutaminase family protein n=1 Tax=Nocardioides sp. CFH 31398 TaxID=2919579 RepID=UPI001F060B72|nr:DUF3488 and transglutaminase-like domain-containing protein [Nocardioides sp. CFH 31398]MCH1868266.1 DUF3488 and transglutaminase-like domain-containing protein [Nocardioides sp. CFH 31398]
MSAAYRRGRLPGGRDLLLAVTACLTAWATTMAWRGFTENPDRFLVPLLAIGLVVAVSGTALRAVRTPGPLVVMVQVALAALGVLRSATGSWLPTPETLALAGRVLEDAVVSAGRYAAPVGGDVPPVEPLLLVAGLACLLLVDVLVCSLRMVSLAGLPLLTVYTLPVSMLGGDVAWWVFAVPAAGFVWMLYQSTAADLERWDAPDGTSDETLPAGTDSGTAGGFGVRTGGVRSTALGLGASATGLALVVPLVVPTLGLGLLDGDGTGGGDREISLTNPMTDLRRDLRRPEDTPLLRFSTSDPDPSYLRISVLNRFSDEAWTSGDRDLPDDQSASGLMPAPEGVAETVARREEQWRFEVSDDFVSAWLPTPFPSQRVDAEGLWKYDLATRDFIAAEEDLTTAGLNYTATGLDLDVTTAALNASTPSSSAVGGEFTELPDDLPLEVRQLSRAVTDGAQTDFDRAVALQQWFRRDGGFTYSLDADSGNGADDLVSFLDDGPDGRIGYCEQFASAMAVMARALDIPARVAVGFLQPEQVGGGAGADAVWEYSSDDLHAWPELYFPGSGWVRFEPTPAGRASAVPDYTRGLGGDREPDAPEAGPGAGDAPLPEQGGGQQGVPEPAPRTPAVEATAAATSPFAAWRTAGLTAGGLALVALLLAAPSLLRRRTRQARRTTADPVEAAWAELRDTVVDLRRPWPHGRSPREALALLEPLLPPDPEPGPPPGARDHAAAVAALRRLAAAVERERYAPASAEGAGPGGPGGTGASDLQADVEAVRVALAAGTGGRQRLLARWAPASALPGAPRTSTPTAATRRTASQAGRPGTVVDRLA